MAVALSYGDKYRENSYLQQQAQAGHDKHEAWDKQRRKHRYAKTGHLMEGGPSKINTPNSHPSNPIHRAAMKAQK